jgi:transcriptional regulator with XRE-family HTH domain
MARKIKDLKDIRVKKGLTQQEVATMANISVAYYCLIENRQKTSGVALRVFQSIADALEIDVQDVVNYVMGE